RTVSFIEPVVHVAKRHDEIGRVVRRDRRSGLEVERGPRDVAVNVGPRLELRFEGLHLALLILERRIVAVLRRIELPTVAQHRREDVRVPAGGRPDLDDRHVGPEPEKLERLLRMTEAIARAVLLATMLAAD